MAGVASFWGLDLRTAQVRASASLAPGAHPGIDQHLDIPPDRECRCGTLPYLSPHQVPCMHRSAHTPSHAGAGGRFPAMMRYRQLAIIASDVGQLFLFIGLFACLPLLVGLWYDEAACLLPMASAPFGFMVIGLLLASVPRVEGEVRVSVALSAVALIWLVAALIGALPFALGLGMPYTDSVFEAMSGWTSTGLSMIVSVDTVPRTLLFWRSLMQWVGGLGIVAFTVAMASRSGLTRFRLYRSEGRSETFLPSVVATGIQMWKIYVVLTLLGTGLVLVSGIPLWDAVNIAMTAISTGGFSVHSAGILYYDSPLLEMLVIPIMLAGALPFKLYYLLVHRRRFGILDDQQALLLFGLHPSRLRRRDVRSGRILRHPAPARPAAGNLYGGKRDHLHGFPERESA